MAVIAVDLLSSNVTCAVIGKSGKIITQDTLSLENLNGKDVSLLIRNQVKKLFDSFVNRPLQIKSVGISIPGIYYSKTGTAWAPNIPGWENYPIKQDMSYFMEQNILVKIASKRTCDILGEKWMGAAKKSRNAIYISVGKGIGAGVLIDGRIVHGFNDGAGAIGWFALDKKFKEDFKSKGCFEYLASSSGILNSINELLKKRPHSSTPLSKKDLSQLKIEDVFVAYKLNDKNAIKVLNEAIVYWGMASANLISVFNPELLIFGGTLFGPAVQFIDRIKEEAIKWAQPIFADNVKFVPSKLGANAGLLGAAHLAMKKF